MGAKNEAPVDVSRSTSLKLHRDPPCGEVSIGSAVAKVMKNLGLPPDGTGPAIESSTLGVATNSDRASSRGGARNSAARVSEGLKHNQVVNLISATYHSFEIGLPFTRMITIHWEGAGVPLAGMASATGHFMDLMTKALARNGGCTSWIWVHEGGPQKGGHCHILVHVPPHVVDVIIRLQKRWIKSISGQPYRSGVIHSKPIGLRLGLEKSNPELHRENVAAVLSYVLKGTSEDVATHVGLPRSEPGGLVIGKRCGTSQNIGAKARAANIPNDVCKTSLTDRYLILYGNKE